MVLQRGVTSEGQVTLADIDPTSSGGALLGVSPFSPPFLQTDLHMALRRDFGYARNKTTLSCKEKAHVRVDAVHLHHAS